MIDTTGVIGYAWPLIVSPGESVAFHLSSATLTSAEAAVVRVRCADPDPAGPGIKVTAPGCAADGVVALGEQRLHPGSYAVVADGPAAAVFTVGAFVWPTRPGEGAQTVVAQWRGGGWRLGLDAQGRPEFVVGVEGREWRAVGPAALLEREWVLLGGAWDGATLRLMVRSLDPQAGRDRSVEVTAAGPEAAAWPAAALTIGGLEGGEAGFDGKVDRPRLYGAGLGIEALHGLVAAIQPPVTDPALLAAWDFSVGIPTDRIHDRSAHQRHGVLRQTPTRGMTGANWDGSTERWTEAPAQYGAIHFHSDDMTDAGWAPSLQLTVPAEWRSGFYALRLQAGDVESYVSFFVRPAADRPRARLAFVASTATFLAYANSALRLDQVHAEAMLEGLLTLSADDVYIQSHREVGLSTYDTHADGSGWCISSARRPLLSFRPRGAVFNYGNDTHLIDWLEAKGFEYDVITDEDIHRDGVRALLPYGCVITGSHPEYISREMLDAFEAYQRGGGRHMYLGGNGFYWRIGFDPAGPHVMEIRRGMNGLRTWEGEAGEHSLQFTGETSGTWRSNGRPPQRLLGVGFDGQVFTRSAAYRWLDGARDPALGWLTAGLDLDAPLGDFGLRGGGAAGVEVDRVEPSLGSPPGLVWLATADRLGYGGTPTPEEVRTLHRGVMGDQNAQVRADLVFMPTAQGGGVFSTGSIAWVCTLSVDGYDNPCSRLTENVLRRFLDPAPLPPPENRTIPGVPPR